MKTGSLLIIDFTTADLGNDGGTTFYPIDEITSAASGSGNTYAATGLTSGTFYWFEVESDESGYRSTPSNAVPEDATGVATPQNVTATATSSSTVSITWKDRTGTATWFSVQCSPDDGADWATLADISGMTPIAGVYSWGDTSATDGTDYLFRVIGHDDMDDSSLPSQTAETTTPIQPPTDMTVGTVSDTEIDLSWTDHSYSAVGDIVYESTDGGSSFYPIDEITPASAGSTNTYQATGLAAGSDYKFYITSESSAVESSPTNTVDQSTTFVPPTLDVEGTGTVVEGQPYELDLTAQYPDGEPGAIDHWHINWGDGTVLNYSYPSGADVTQPLAVTHVFAAGTASPTVAVQAVDLVNGTFTADSQSVAVTPKDFASAPTVSASGSSITVNWTNVSSISTGTTVLVSTDGTTFFEAGSATSGLSSLTIPGLIPDTNYWVETIAEGANGESDASAAQEVATPFVAPTLVVTPVNTPTEGQSYTLNLSATYAVGTPTQDMISSWQVDWGDGNGVQSYSGAAVTESSGWYPSGVSSATIHITAIDSNGYSTTTSNVLRLLANPIDAGSVVGSSASGGASGTLHWRDSSSIAASYVVQRLNPGGTAWQTIGIVPVNTDGDSYYTFSDTTLTPSLIGGDSGELYRVAPETAAQAAEGSAAIDSLDFSSAVSIGTSPNVKSGTLYDGESNIGTEGDVGITSSLTGYSFPSGSTDTITITNLPPHMAFNLTLQGGVSYPNPYAEYPNPDDLITLTGPDGKTITQSGENSGLNDGIATGLSYGDQNSMTSAVFNVTGYVPDEDGNWYVYPTVTTYLGNVSVRPEPLSVGDVAWLPVHFNCDDFEDVTQVTLNVVNYDPGIIKPLSNTVTLEETSTDNFDGFLPVTGINAGSTDLVLQDAIGDEGSTTITCSPGATAPFHLTLPAAPNFAGLGGNWQNNLGLVAGGVIAAANPFAAIVLGIQGNIVNQATGQTFNWPDPTHFYIDPNGPGSVPTVLFYPQAIPITTITDLPNPTGTTIPYVPVPLQVKGLSLTVWDDSNPTDQTTSMAGETHNLYVAENQDGTATIDLIAVDQTGWPNSNITYTISGTATDHPNGDFGGGVITATLTPGDQEFTVTASENGSTAIVDVYPVLASLHIDSNNDGQITSADDAIKQDSASPGKVILTNTLTDSANGPGYAEGLLPGDVNPATYQLTPVMVELDGPALPGATISFDYSGADPSLSSMSSAGVFSIGSSGYARLWNWDVSPDSPNKSSVADFGSYIAPGVSKR